MASLFPKAGTAVSPLFWHHRVVALVSAASAQTCPCTWTPRSGISTAKRSTHFAAQGRRKALYDLSFNCFSTIVLFSALPFFSFFLPCPLPVPKSGCKVRLVQFQNVLCVCVCVCAAVPLLSLINDKDLVCTSESLFSNRIVFFSENKKIYRVERGSNNNKEESVSTCSRKYIRNRRRERSRAVCTRLLHLLETRQQQHQCF